MCFNKSVLSKLFIFLLIVFSVFTRFYKLDWGDGYFFHPDENNMASAIVQLKPDNLNPHFFAYGQFPLYLSYFSLQTITIPLSFDSAIIMLRFWSAFFSILSLLFIYLISKNFLTPTYSMLVVLFSIFTPGLIQMSHFGTTESLLLLIFLIEIYLAIRIYSSPHQNFRYILAAVALGVGLATKISALIFLTPLFIIFLVNYLKLKSWVSLLSKSIFSLIISFVVFIILSPYTLLAFPEFLSSINYETSVASGKQLVFYTSQFIHTIPYWFQLTRIFPYVFGMSLCLFGLIGLVFLFKNYKKLPHQQKIFWLIILISVVVYFAYFGQLFTKWTRFMSPIFFLFPLLAAYAIAQSKSIFIKYFLIFIGCLPGLYFMNLYFQPDIRVSASQWIETNIPSGSMILSESGNVVNIPITNKSYQVINFDFYNLDQNPILTTSLPGLISQADYIIVPSRRIFKNQSTNNFPLTQDYYQKLFSGNLGFKEIKTFYPSTDLFLNPENAEETWSVFDRPTIRIFKRTNS